MSSSDPMEPLTNLVKRLQQVTEEIGLELAAPPMIMPNMEGGPHMIQVAFLISDMPANASPNALPSGDTLDGSSLSPEEAAMFEQLAHSTKKDEEAELERKTRADLESLLKDFGAE